MPTFEDILAELFNKEMKGIEAKALDVIGFVLDKQVFVDLCPEFAKMSTAQIEDFLCIYKSYLNGEIDTEQELTPECCCKAKPRRSRSCGQ